MQASTRRSDSAGFLPGAPITSAQKVTTAEMWWRQRRPEIVEDFEREVVGRVPKQAPGVKWTVVSRVANGLVGNLPANGKQLLGQVDTTGWRATS
jgi:hypothetical protein